MVNSPTFDLALKMTVGAITGKSVIASDKNPYQVAITLPALHPKQAEIAQHSARRKVVVTGRRFGKTFMGASMAASALLEQKRVLICSTSQDQADIFWRYLKEWLSTLYGQSAGYKNETKRIVSYNKGSIRVKTGSDPDVLRGEDADLLILDECAYLDPNAWYAVGAPMMADRDGTAIFISTPARKNWFYALYQRAIADTSGRWAAWHATTLDNPFLNKTAVDELIQDMTEETYKQEILAEFLEGSGQVFRNIEACATAQPPTAPYPGNFVIGVDLAQTTDYTVITVMDSDNHHMVDWDRFNRASWEIVRGRIKALYTKWNPSAIWVESNSIGGPNAEALENDGLPIYRFETTATSKTPLIESLVLAFERQELSIFSDPVLVGELGAYERKVSPSTGRSQYSAPEGLHDDCVMSLAIAWHGVINRVWSY